MKNIVRRKPVAKGKRLQKEPAAQGRVSVGYTLPAGMVRALERVAAEKTNGNRSRVIEAALFEVFDRLQGPLHAEVAALLREDDPVARLRAELAEK